MKRGTIYNLATGQIEMNVEAPDEAGIVLQTTGREGLAIVFDEMFDSMQVYIQNELPVPRPEMPWVGGDVGLTVGEVFRLDGIPVGSSVRHPGGSAVVNDGFIEWSTNEPGSYLIQVINFPYKEVNFNAIVR